MRREQEIRFRAFCQVYLISLGLGQSSNISGQGEKGEGEKKDECPGTSSSREFPHNLCSALFFFLEGSDHTRVDGPVLMILGLSIRNAATQP